VLSGCLLAFGLLLGASAAVHAQPVYVRAQDTGGNTLYLSNQIQSGVDVVNVHLPDGSVAVTANIIGAGRYRVDVYKAGTNGGTDEAPPGQALSFTINGIPADINMVTDPDGDGVFATTFASQTPTAHVIELAVPAGGMLALSPADFGLGNGATQQLSVTYDLGGGDVRDVDETDASVTFASSDAGVATVDANGLVTAQTANVGQATITVTLPGGVTATATVRTGKRLVFDTEPGGSVSGQPLTTQPVVRTDLGGVDASYTGPITLSLAAGAGSLSGTLTVNGTCVKITDKTCTEQGNFKILHL
jgi:hypothetical protein